MLTGIALNSFSETKSENLFNRASQLDDVYPAPTKYNLARFKINQNAQNSKRNEKDLHEKLNSLLNQSNSQLTAIKAL